MDSSDRRGLDRIRKTDVFRYFPEMLKFTERGIWCPKADVYIDPWKPVARAIITHGHSDHARRGHKSYLAHPLTAAVIKHRLQTEAVETLEYQIPLDINGVKISFHPAGHIPGSSQVRLEYKGEVAVVSGDYKTKADGFSEAFEPVKCNHFITESTFGLPVFHWKEEAVVMDEILEWWKKNTAEGMASILTAYPLGKAQRLIHGLGGRTGKVWVDGSVAAMNAVLEGAGMELPEWEPVRAETGKEELEGSMIVATPSGAERIQRKVPSAVAFASGWMQVRGIRRRRGGGRGFVISDHADWDGLIEAVKATGAENIYVTHGYQEAFSAFLSSKGYHASIVETLFIGESDEDQ